MAFIRHVLCIDALRGKQLHLALMGYGLVQRIIWDSVCRQDILYRQENKMPPTIQWGVIWDDSLVGKAADS